MAEPDRVPQLLDEAEHTKAAEAAPLRARVIHEIIREEGEVELRRDAASLAWSGLSAGLSMGFSFLAFCFIRAELPNAPWRHLAASLGYSVGFVIVILGRQQLFTENTLTAVLPVLTSRTLRSVGLTLRLWGIVLLTNLAGTWIFAALITPHAIFEPGIRDNLLAVAHATVSGPFGPKLLKAVLAGWLIALMVWLLPNAGSARLFVIILVTYVVSLGRFSHIIAGSTDAAFAVTAGGAPFVDYLRGFLAPTLIGNTIGGVSLVALLNYAPVATELEERRQD